MSRLADRIRVVAQPSPQPKKQASISELKKEIERIEKQPPKPKKAAARKMAKAAPAAEEKPALAEAGSKRGRPASGKAKEKISIRLDREVIEGFKARGDGWQSLVNEALRAHLGISGEARN